MKEDSLGTLTPTLIESSAAPTEIDPDSSPERRGEGVRLASVRLGWLWIAWVGFACLGWLCLLGPRAACVGWFFACLGPEGLARA